eukprot:1782618-Lingulodinium_polyedra.AAC.1
MAGSGTAGAEGGAASSTLMPEDWGSSATDGSCEATELLGLALAEIGRLALPCVATAQPRANCGTAP